MKYGVGIDVSKGKSTVFICKPYGEIVSSPFEVKHTEKGLSELATMLKLFDEETKVVMESTGNYHYPILLYLLKQGIFISVINSLAMHKYVNYSLRSAKTDKIDSMKIANYGIEHWYDLKKYKIQDDNYYQLQLLGRQYAHYMEMRIKEYLYFYSILDQVLPCIKKLVSGNHPTRFEKDKLLDFVEKYCHFDIILEFSEYEFVFKLV